MHQGEQQAIQNISTPITMAALVADLQALGIRRDMTLITHSSLSSIGWVVGGAASVVKALRTVTAEGTLIMPTQSGDNSDPAHWQRPPVPPEWWPIIRAEMPAFDPDLTPTRGMGAVVECFRHLRGVIRSRHPQLSFAAIGRDAERLLADHPLDYGLGEGSPLARLYDLDGWILLLGVGFDSCTALHLAEHRAPEATPVTDYGAALVDGQRQWLAMQNIEYDVEMFPDLGAAYWLAASPADAQRGSVGAASAQLLRVRPLIDFAVEWITQRRKHAVK